MGRSWSIRRTLPLGITGLLLVVLASFVFLARSQVDSAILTASADQMDAAVQQVATTIATSVQGSLASLGETAARPVLVAYLSAPDSATRAAIEPELQRLLVPLAGAEGDPVEVWSAEGELLLTLGGDPRPGLPDAGLVPAPAPGVGPLRTDGDRVYFRIAAPVAPEGEGADEASAESALGTLVLRPDLSGGASQRLVAQLIGPGTSVLFANRTGDIWTDLAAPVRGPELPPGWNGAASRRPYDGGEALMAMAPVDGTPWMVWAANPVDAVLAPSRAFVRDSALIALFLVSAGAVVAWLLSRSITRPLVRLAGAASTIGRGELPARLDEGRKDELGLVARAFDGMAEEIADARSRLEVRVAERTAQVEAANREIAETQEKLARREKLAMLGQLASGVGHELRNPLGVMNNAVYYLRTILPDAPERAREYLDILGNQIQLSEKIIHDLLDMSRVQAPQAEPIPLDALVEEHLERTAIPSEIEVRVDLPSELPPVLADRTQMGQVLLNLLTNAVQAMPEGEAGRIEIRAVEEEGGTVRVDITDTGEGMSPETLEKVFEPLFTTKARGIGLGLAISRLLVERNEGELMVESREGEGSTFTVVLPSGVRHSRA